MSHPKAWRSTVSGKKASVVAGSVEIIRKWPEFRLNKHLNKSSLN
jgi:hypothetical protein